MICLIDDKLSIKLFEFCKGDPLACKIESLARAYGFDVEFANFWIQHNSEGIVTAAISRFDSAAVIYANSKADFNELGNFFSFLGVSVILSSEAIYNNIFSTVKVTKPTASIVNGAIMKLKTLVNYNFTNSLSVTTNPSLKAIYSLMCDFSQEGFEVPDFEEFYVDMSHKIRHNLARSVGVYDEGELISCALTVSETSDCAIIGAVATRPDKRRNGYGNIVVSEVVHQLKNENKDIYIFRAKCKNQEFYKKIGFYDYMRWAQISL